LATIDVWQRKPLDFLMKMIIVAAAFFFSGYESLLWFATLPEKAWFFFLRLHIGLRGHIAYDVVFPASIFSLIHDTISSSIQATRPFEIRMGLGNAPSRIRRQAVVLLRGTRSTTWGQDSNRVAEPPDIDLKAFNAPSDLTVTRAKLFGTLRNLAIDVGPFQ
jgi:hypothetical protein